VPPSYPAAPQPPSYQAGYPEQPPSYPPPPGGGYGVPTTYPGGMVGGDALVLPPGAPFAAWFAKVQEIGKRSWKSALIICAIGIAAPRAIAALISGAAGWSAGLSVTSLGTYGSFIGSFILAGFVTLIVSIAACYVAAAGWAAGTWALVQEAQTGQQANLGQAFQYGLKRATGLFPWTVLAAAAFTIASACLFLPGIYVAFGFSMFGFVALFERGKSPISRSFSLTHNSATIGPTLGKVGIAFGAYFVYSIIVGVIFGAITVAISVGAGFNASFGTNVAYGFVQAIAALLSAPAFAVLLIGLLPTYAELRAREAPLSTAQLQQELGA
jgi:hypothetical protein